MLHLSQCPRPQDLERFLLGHGDQAEAARFEGHLDECPHCEALLSRFRSGDKLLDAMKGVAACEAAPTPQVSNLMDRLAALPVHEGDTTLDFSFLAPADGSEEIGRLGGYRVLRVLGRGGMGIVFLAEDPLLRRSAALKVMRPELLSAAEERSRFLGEARKAAAIAHDHIVTVYQVGEDRGIPFLAMQLLEGETLEERLLRENRLPSTEAVRITREVAQGLAAAHAQGLIHRDVKPANLWLERGSGRVKLLDFGLARAVEGDSVHSPVGTLLGTPAYMAPEQARGTPEQRSDLFSLGCVLYRMLTGQAPFIGSDVVAKLIAVAQDTPKPPRALNAEVPHDLSDLTMRLLAKSPEKRPATATDLIAALTPAPMRLRSHRRVAVLLAAAALLVVAGITVINIRHPDRSVTEIRTQGAVNVEKEGRAAGRIAIVPEKSGPLEVGEPLGAYALVNRPAPLPGVRSWTFETRGHRGNVNAIAYSPDGRWLATAGEDGTTRVWDARTGALVRGLIGQQPVLYSLAWAPDSRTLVSLSSDEFWYWDVVEGRTLRRVPREPGRAISQTAWAPDGETLATGSDRGVTLWDPRDGTIRRTLPFSRAASVYALAISPDSRTVAVASRDHLVTLWDIVSGEKRFTLKGHTKPINAVAYSLDGKTLASTAEDGTTRLWDATTGEPGHVLVEAKDCPLTALAWSLDGRRLFAVNKHGGTSFWDVATGKKQASLANDSQEYYAAAWSPDGSTVTATGSKGHVEHWDAKTLERHTPCRGHHMASGSSAAIAPDGCSLAIWDQKVRIWRLDAADTPRELSRIGDHGGQLVWSPDARKLIGGAYLGSLRLWDIASGDHRDLLPPSSGRTEGVAWSPNSQRVAAGEGKVVRVWDANGDRLHALEGAEAPINGLAWSPGGDRLASFHLGKVCIWDMTALRLERTLKQDGAFACGAWSLDGRTLAAGGSNFRRVFLWDIATGEPHVALEANRENLRFVSWLADGKALIGAVHGHLHVWNSETSRLLRTQPMPRVSSFSADRKRLVSYWANAAHLWDAETGHGRGALVTFRDNRWALIAPDGRFRGNARLETELVAVVLTDKGQETLDLEEFARKFGWKNDPTQVRLTPP